MAAIDADHGGVGDQGEHGSASGGRWAPELARAAALLEIGRAEQALDELSRLPAHLAEDPAAFRLRVAALIALERWKEAEVAARQGLQAGGPDPDLLADLGLALRSMGRYPEAERALLDGLAIEPNNINLLCRYALLCMSVGQLPKADALLDRAANQSPTAPIVYATRIELAFARGQDRKAERLSREFLAEYPEHPAALALHARSAALRGRVVPAYGSIRGVVAADPGDAEIAEAALELRAAAHPLLAPLRPLYRLGTVRSWLLGVGILGALYLLGFTVAAAIFAFAWFLYIVYSWTAPAAVRRLTGAARTDPAWQRALWWVGSSAALLVGLSCTGLTVVDLGPALAAANGQGTVGTIVLTRQECDRRSCDWFGDFTSDDGTVSRTDVAMQEGVPEDAKVGDELRARDTGARDGVFPVEGSSEWVFVLIFLVVGVLLVVGWVLAVPVLELVRRFR